MRDSEAIVCIGERGERLCAALDVTYKRLDCMMDVETVHDSIGLDLEALLTADDGNFGHDIGGIRRHLNRITGELEDCFVPRFSR
jgi:hypothetical protein